MNKHSQLVISGQQPDDIDKYHLEDTMTASCEFMGLSHNVVVSLVFCSTQEMKELNRKYRGVDAETDVLSFPASETSELFLSDPDSSIYLGEILIDLNYISQYAINEILVNEIRKVFIHGLLHILGYDHLNVSQKQEMTDIEDKIYARLRWV